MSPLDSFSRSAFTYVNVNVTNQSRALEGQPTQYALPRRRRRQIALPRRRRRQVTSRPRTCRARPAGPAASVPRRQRCRTQATRRHLPNGAARPRRRSCHSERHQHAVGAWRAVRTRSPLLHEALTERGGGSPVCAARTIDHGTPPVPRQYKACVAAGGRSEDEFSTRIARGGRRNCTETTLINFQRSCELRCSVTMTATALWSRRS